MSDEELRIAQAAELTRVIRPPKQALATFGSTVVRYYLVTEPAYTDLNLPKTGAEETVVREGEVRADKPQVVTPYYMLRAEGFGENATRYLQQIMEQYGPHAPGLLYTYKNEHKNTGIVSGRAREVALRLGERLDKEEKHLEAVIQGVDDMWDVSLMKFIYEYTSASARANVAELNAHGLLHSDAGVPRDVRMRIERLIGMARRGEAQPSDVHRELERWGLFDEYEDQFLELFKKR